MSPSRVTAIEAHGGAGLEVLPDDVAGAGEELVDVPPPSRIRRDVRHCLLPQRLAAADVVLSSRLWENSKPQRRRRSGRVSKQNKCWYGGPAEQQPLV